jgi:CRP/FNR family transcriptional regulator, cyclic AMP receptor protein
MPVFFELGARLMSVLEIFRDAHEFEEYKPGDVVFKEGDPPTVMYVVKEGELEVLKGDKVLAVVGPGTILGEMALVDSRPRSATIRAKTDAKLVYIDKKLFKFLIQQTPDFAFQVMSIMADRIRRMDSMI